MQPFEFVVPERPVSLQARGGKRKRQSWIDTVRAAAQSAWIGGEPTEGPFQVSICHVYDEVELDVDNIIKPIMDALIGIVYPDDEFVTDVACRKRSLLGIVVGEQVPPPILDAFADGHEFVIVRVEDAPPQDRLP